MGRCCIRPLPVNRYRPFPSTAKAVKNRMEVPEFFRLIGAAWAFKSPEVPLTLKQYWQTHLDTYFRSRQSLKGVILLTDIRHALKPFDEMMLEWSHTAGLPIHVLLTKADKLARGAQQNALLKVNANLPKHAKAQTFSAPNGQGLETLKSVLDSWLSIDP